MNNKYKYSFKKRLYIKLFCFFFNYKKDFLTIFSKINLSYKFFLNIFNNFSHDINIFLIIYINKNYYNIDIILNIWQLLLKILIFIKY